MPNDMQANISLTVEITILSTSKLVVIELIEVRELLRFLILP